jgi:hypothetical protein
MKSLNQLASDIAKLEGKKSQARIGDIREILKLIVDMSVEKMDDLNGNPLLVLQHLALTKFHKKNKYKR